MVDEDRNPEQIADPAGSCEHPVGAQSRSQRRRASGWIHRPDRRRDGAGRGGRAFRGDPRFFTALRQLIEARSKASPFPLAPQPVRAPAARAAPGTDRPPGRTSRRRNVYLREEAKEAILRQLRADERRRATSTSRSSGRCDLLADKLPVRRSSRATDQARRAERAGRCRRIQLRPHVSGERRHDTDCSDRCIRCSSCCACCGRPGGLRSSAAPRCKAWASISGSTSRCRSTRRSRRGRPDGRARRLLRRASRSSWCWPITAARCSAPGAQRTGRGPCSTCRSTSARTSRCVTVSFDPRETPEMAAAKKKTYLRALRPARRPRTAGIS